MAAPMQWKQTRKWTLSAAKNLTWVEIGAMTIQEQADLAQFYYQKFNARLNEVWRKGIDSREQKVNMPLPMEDLLNHFERMKDQYISVNGETMSLADYIGFTPMTPITVGKNGMRQFNPAFADIVNKTNGLYAYISAMQHYFDSKTGTYAGWNAYTRKQDAMLFGSYSISGNPRHRMTNDERRAFWKMFNEARAMGLFGTSDVLRESTFTTEWRENTGLQEMAMSNDENSLILALDYLREIIGKPKAMAPQLAYKADRILHGEDPNSYDGMDMADFFGFTPREIYERNASILDFYKF